MVDYRALAEGIDEMRESLRAMVSGLTADGFTEEQAREIVTAVLRQSGKGEESNG
jgi:uncharacterized membrane protein YebE (DUF533 family)